MQWHIQFFLKISHSLATANSGNKLFFLRKKGGIFFKISHSLATGEPLQNLTTRLVVSVAFFLKNSHGLGTSDSGGTIFIFLKKKIWAGFNLTICKSRPIWHRF